MLSGQNVRKADKEIIENFENFVCVTLVQLKGTVKGGLVKFVNVAEVPVVQGREKVVEMFV
jgi:hypothetical protein